MRIYPTAAPASSNQLVTTAQGFLATTGRTDMAHTTSIPTANAASGSLVLGLVGLRAGQTVTNISVCVTANSTNVTFAKLGLFSSTGTFLMATASASATFNAGSAGFRTVALTTPYVVPTDGAYYAAFLQYGSGATGATLIIQGGGLGGVGTQFGTGARAEATVANQTDISANVTLADSATPFWFGVS